MQIYVSRREAELSAAVLQALSAAGADFRTVRWVAPLESEGFREPLDGSFLDALGLGHLRTPLQSFWPKRGPSWDALALLEPGPGILLVEGKSYPEEIFGSGCVATEPARSLISKSLEATRGWTGARVDADWLGPLYQFANRLAHVHFLRGAGHPTWLANVCFLNDRTTRPTTLEEWQTRLQPLKRQLGFESGSVPHSVDVFLEAYPRSELTSAI
ncbi:MAG: hypothetical protein ABIQ86_06855 [Steroidobacteraceae bacterium]